MTSPENPRFTTVIANRLWKRVFGLALIEPLDELMDTTVPMIPELQKHLEKLVVDLNYDMKAVLRVLYNTKAYQAQVSREEHAPGEVYHFTGPLLRRMSAEQMWDSFVTLINPSPDMINQANRDAMEQRILQAQEDRRRRRVPHARGSSRRPEESRRHLQQEPRAHRSAAEALRRSPRRGQGSCGTRPMPCPKARQEAAECQG